MDQRIRKQIWDYFHARDQALWHAYVASEDSQREEENEIAKSADKTAESELDEVLKQYMRVGNALRYGFLIAACSFLEDVVKTICRLCDHNYDEQQVEKKSPKKANWLNKHLLHLKNNQLIYVDDEKKLREIEQELSYAITLRNCVGHAWGNISNARFPEQVRGAIKTLEENTSNCDYASESKDKHLVIGADLLPHVFHQSEVLIELLLEMPRQSAPARPQPER